MTFTDEDMAFASLVGWCGYIDPSWRAYPHLVLLCRELEDFAFAVARGEERRLGVFMPPQHGKTLVTSVGFTTWVLGRWPSTRIILASYESERATQCGRYARDALSAHGERVFGVRLNKASTAADHWELASPHRGAFHSAGLAAGITGQPCEIAVIDDPHRNREAAESEPITTKIVDNYKGALLSRMPRGVVNVMTRWSPTDLAGWIEQNEKHMPWRIVRLPAFAEEDDPLGRAPGEVLCEALRPRALLENLRQTQSSYEWAGMFQQLPIPRGGGLFKREHAKFYDLRGPWYVVNESTKFTESTMTRFVTVDTATSAKTSSDQTAIAAWGAAGGMLFLLDLDMRRIEAPEIMRAVKAMCSRWRTIAWVEDTTQSKHLLSFMEAENVLFKRVAPGSVDKFTRALPASALWEQGKVWLPRSAEWLAAAERQVYSFTGKDGGADDFVDCLAYAANVHAQTGDPWPFAPVKPEKHFPSVGIMDGATLPKPAGW